MDSSAGSFSTSPWLKVLLPYARTSPLSSAKTWPRPALGSGGIGSSKRACGVSTDFQEVPSQCIETGWLYRSP
ncbi:hypothetical protein [Streptomyces sp. NPDC057284]|uniref:hypothetical protein n=1 Tax=Streptomyces sp. NPDC057284 TaxID=3346083 RepID=UPI00363F3350